MGRISGIESKRPAVVVGLECKSKNTEGLKGKKRQEEGRTEEGIEEGE